MIRSRRLKRRTQHERFGEMPNKTKNWNKLFPIDVKEFKRFNLIKTKIEERARFQTDTQKIGKIREDKVLSALKSLKEKTKIKDFIKTAKFGKLDLMEGIDFRIIYIEKIYKIIDFSVTGQKWIETHRKRYPEIPVLPVFLEESVFSVEKKILRLLGI